MPAERYAEHTPNCLAVGGDRDAWCMRPPPLVCVCGEEGLEGRVLFTIVIADFLCRLGLVVGVYFGFLEVVFLRFCSCLRRCYCELR